MRKTNKDYIRHTVPTRIFKKQDIAGWLIMLPTLILFAFFVWEPLLESVRLSLYSANGVKLQKFVGLDNYIAAIRHPVFFPALINTFKYILWSLIIGFFMPVLMALFISETVHFKGLFRIGIYIPNVVPGIATVFIWRYFFYAGPNGVLNILLSKIGLEPMVWLSNAKLTIPIIVGALTWRGAGATALIYIAAISNINPELYEAATIDGAGILQRIRHITMPSLFSLGKTLLILQIIAVFQIYYEPLVLTHGGPNNASYSIIQLVYDFAFTDYNFPKASAISVMVCIILIILSGLYMKLTKIREE